MKLEQTFTVHAPVETVWEALIDVERVAPCLPGAEVTENVGDGTYKGAFTVKLGPTTAAYTGSLKMESLDESEHVATMSARGTDKRGQGGANATIVSTVGEDPAGGTKVDVVTDFSITGKLARFGRGGMIQDVANRMLREFAANLEEEVQAGPAGSGLAGAATPGSAAPDPESSSVVDPVAAATPDAVVAAGEAGSVEAHAATSDAGAQTAPPSSPRQAPPPSRSAPRAPAKPVSAFSLLLGALMDRLRRLFGRLFRRRT